MVIESIFGQKPVTAVGYRSPESGQVEKKIFFECTAQNTWETAYTVTTGTTLYIHTITITNREAAGKLVTVGVGDSAVFEYQIPATNTTTTSFVIPLPFETATVVQIKTSDAGTSQSVTLVGFEE